jgi:hypothetical protein
MQRQKGCCPRIAFGLFLVLAAVSGCWSSAGPLVPVEGVVKLDGRPAGNLQVIFTQAEAPAGKQRVSASAISDASGRFVLKMPDGSTGIPVGAYKVAVVDFNLAVDEEPVPGKPHIPNRVPIQYADVLRTPLTIEVAEGKTSYEVDVRTGGGVNLLPGGDGD